MKPYKHIAVSLVISSVVYLYFKSWMAFFVSFLAGVFIDIDHLMDYWAQKGPTLEFVKMYRWFSGRQYKYIGILFHSIELIIVFWGAIYIFRPGIFWVALAIGLTQHLIFDIIFNRRLIHWYGYFLLYRIYAGFKRTRICGF